MRKIDLHYYHIKYFFNDGHSSLASPIKTTPISILNFLKGTGNRVIKHFMCSRIFRLLSFRRVCPVYDDEDIVYINSRQTADRIKKVIELKPSVQCPATLGGILMVSAKSLRFFFNRLNSSFCL